MTHPQTAPPSRAALGDGGLWLGTNGTSGLFLAAIVSAVAWFSLQHGRGKTFEQATPEEYAA